MAVRGSWGVLSVTCRGYSRISATQHMNLLCHGDPSRECTDRMVWAGVGHLQRRLKDSRLIWPVAHHWAALVL